MDKKRINVGILFGGKSAEHEVSIKSAKNIFNAIDQQKYNPILIKIDKSGKWLLVKDFESSSGDLIAIIPQSNGKVFNITKRHDDLIINVIFPILHGPFGEDGTIQGLLKLANLPFVGADVLGSAVGMDKDVMKRLLRDTNIPIGKFIMLKYHELVPDFLEIKNKLSLPFFIKPANMGSSIGISKIHNKTEFIQGIEKAFEFDTKIILEENIQGREVECSVLGNTNPAVSIPGEVIPSHEFYSYDAKYIDGNGARLDIPAKISDELTKSIQALAIQTFQTLSCEGLGRVDFFLKDNNELIVNEINTMPGFTKNSMYPKLWEASGLSYSELIDKLIVLAIERFNKQQNLKTNYK